MQNHTTHSRPIVLSLALDGSDQALLNVGRLLARKLHAPLELVHAVRPTFNYVGAGDIILNPYYDYENTFNESEEREARSRLEALAESIDDVVTVRPRIVRDFPAEAALTVAQEQEAGLIICGVRRREGKRFLSGLTTAFSLASDAEVPVLMIPIAESAFEITFPLRILVADNLQAEGEKALAMGVALANDLHAESLVHFHVIESSQEDIDKMIDSVQESILRGNLPANTRLTRDYYMERVQERASLELKKRCEGCESRALQSTVYETALAFGEPADEIHKALHESGAQITIFGRHHLLRKKNLSLGRIPYHAMIEAGTATLVVPDRIEARSGFLGTQINYEGENRV